MDGRSALAAAALLLGGCGSGGELSFEFRSLGGDDQIDQTIWIENPGDASVAPRLRFTALDGSGDPIEGVTVQTAYGSDRGTRVVPARAR